MRESYIVVTSANTKQLKKPISNYTKNQFMMELSLVVTSANTKQLQNQISNHTKNQFMIELKGKLGDFFLFVQSFYWPKTKTSFNRQFSPKRPKLVKNQAKGSEIHQIRTKWHPSYCGNPSILSSDLAVKIKRSLQGSPVENKMLRSWMFWR